MKDKEMTKVAIEASLKNVKANFAIEGMDLTDREIERGRRLLAGEITFEEGMNELIENYRKEEKDEL